MSEIHIEWLGDAHDCKLCGPSYAGGARVTIDGAVILDLKPRAHCYNDESYSEEEVFKRILAHLGHSIVET